MLAQATLASGSVVGRNGRLVAKAQDLSSNVALCCVTGNGLHLLSGSVRRRHLRKIARKARREFEAERAVLPRGKPWSRSSGSMAAREDRDEWTEEIRAHCERCYDDKAETPEVQAERIRRQRISGRSTCGLSGASCYDHGGQGSADTRQDAEEQGQCGLYGKLGREDGL